MPAESTLQSKIVADLKKSGWIVNKISLCSNAGWPDLEAFKASKVIFFEIKAPKKHPSSLQILRHEQLKNQGFEVFLVDSWEKYKDAMKPY